MTAVDSMTDIGLCALAERIAHRDVSALAVTEAFLERFRVVGDTLNCVRSMDSERALRTAERIDAALKRNESPGPLWGVPLAHKDLFYRAGKVVTCGSSIRRDYVPAITATVLDRLDQAGTVTLGTLSLAEFAMGPTGWNEHFGPTRNPWNTAHVSGGSSSGSGAAVAAGLAAGSLGTDTGGSVRIPAAFCGVTGLKPTQGRVSRFGVLPLSHSLDCVGLVTRSARDCARLLSVIAGPDPADPTAAEIAVPNYEGLLDGDVRGMRVAVPRAIIEAMAEPDVAQAVTGIVETLSERGVSRLDVADPDIALLNALNGLLFLSEAAAVHAPWLTERRDDYGPQVRERLLRGLYFPATRYIDAMRLRGPMLKAFLKETLADADALILPTLPVTAPTVEAAASRDISAVMALNAKLTPFTPLANYLGLPALGIPGGFDRNGMPIGVQLIGRPFAEGRLLRLADAFQRDTTWHQAFPHVA